MANPLFEALNGNRMAGMLEQFQQFRKEMEGRNPNEEINRLLQSGKINQQQLNQAQTNILQNTVNNGFRDVIDAQNAGTQRIIDLFTQDKIQSLQTELQSAQLQLSNNAQTNSILNALRPTPVPSYPVMSPYTSIVNPTGFSFGAGCGYGGNTGCGC